MPKYRVDYHYTNYESVIIKANSPEEAQKKVIDCGLNQYETGPNIVDNVEEIEDE